MRDVVDFVIRALESDPSALTDEEAVRLILVGVAKAGGLFARRIVDEALDREVRCLKCASTGLRLDLCRCNPPRPELAS